MDDLRSGRRCASGAPKIATPSQSVSFDSLRFVSTHAASNSVLQGHTHNKLDQRFSVLATALARQDILQTPEVSAVRKVGGQVGVGPRSSRTVLGKTITDRR